MSKEARVVSKSIVNTKLVVQIGMLAAIAVVLMLFEVPLPFAPGFYKLDLSEVPVLIGGFLLGPLAAVGIEFVKIMLNFIMDGTVTAGVGELANFLIGCSFCVPAGMIYRKNKTKKGALLGLMGGVGLMTIVGCLLNAFVLLPAYAVAFQLPIDELIQMGTVINKNITDLTTFVIYVVAPFNLIKGIVVSVVVMLSYKQVKKGLSSMMSIK